ncbi:MAG: GntR family transcriptional regulator [Eubacteriaceae bacterium]|nr:GntR family transcriptional regulator [Eubacteriaceae bacterium]
MCAANQMEYEKVIKYILSLVTDGKLTVGSKLPTERALSETLDMGRNSIREALSILHGMGIIKRVQGSGNYISDDVDKSLHNMLVIMLALGTVTKKDVCEFRRTLDKTACMIILQKGINDIDKSRFESCISGMKTDDSIRQAEFDREFHALLLELSDNILLRMVMEAVMTVYRQWIDIVLKEADKEAVSQLLVFHEGIYKGLTEANEDFVNMNIDAHYDLIEEFIV